MTLVIIVWWFLWLFSYSTQSAVTKAISHNKYDGGKQVCSHAMPLNGSLVQWHILQL